MNYLKIDKCDYLNGVGVGAVLWLSGCSHHCDGCQNQKSWGANAGKTFDKEVEDELIECLNKPYIGRLTLSGGDPLYKNNIQDVLNLVNKIRILFPDKAIWLYTGSTWEQCLEDEEKYKIVEQCDVMVDGRYVDELRDVTLRWRGSSNQRVIDVKQSIKDGQIRLYTQ